MFTWGWLMPVASLGHHPSFMSLCWPMVTLLGLQAKANGRLSTLAWGRWGPLTGIGG